MRLKQMVIILLVVSLLSGCAAKQEAPGSKDRPQEEVPRTDEYNDQYEPDDKLRQKQEDNIEKQEEL
ncbi:MAG: hypothetical protein ACQEQI_06445 [Bacillota bacterium]